MAKKKDQKKDVDRLLKMLEEELGVGNMAVIWPDDSEEVIKKKIDMLEAMQEKKNSSVH